MVMPWFKNGNAVHYLENKPSGECVRICLEAAYGLQYLHTLPTPVVHGTLKGSNILVSDEGSALLSDFGLSVLAGDENSTSFPTRYHLWMSLETLTGEQTIKSDIWAWAMTTLELVSGKQPFYREKHTTRHLKTISEGGRPKIEDYQSPAFGTTQDCGHFWRAAGKKQRAALAFRRLCKKWRPLSVANRKLELMV